MDEKTESGKKKMKEDEKIKQQVIDQIAQGTSITAISKKMHLMSSEKTKQLLVDHICEQLKAKKTMEMIAESLNKSPLPLFVPYQTSSPTIEETLLLQFY